MVIPRFFSFEKLDLPKILKTNFAMEETRLFVGNIPHETQEHELMAEFGYYGRVRSVELKRKEQETCFGFINIEIGDKLLQKCIREFQQQKFKGNFLQISKAKESFLEKLKRERDVGRRLFEMAFQNAESTDKKVSQPSPHVALPTINKIVSSDESSSSEEEEREMDPKPVPQSAHKPKALDKAALDDMKRKESLKRLKDAYMEQKNAIKCALAGDSVPKNNKIIFEPPEPVQQKEMKPTLFDDDEDVDFNDESFKIKKQFAGQKGEKLFELQTKFHDSRFEIDAKFAEEDGYLDSRKKYTREELLERKRLRKELENWDQSDLKEERDNQLSILQNITGESINPAYSNKLRKPTSKEGMLRFDPTKKEHLKYLDIVREIELSDEADNAIKDSENIREEKFYDVSGNLSEAFHKSDSAPFSIFSMLGINNDYNCVEEKVEEKAQDIKLPLKVQSFQITQAKFKYDSSDTDEEAEEAKTKHKLQKNKPVKKSKYGKYSKSGIWRNNFFIADGDERLKEAFSFIKKSENISPQALDEHRKKLKRSVKTKVKKAKKENSKIKRRKL